MLTITIFYNIFLAAIYALNTYCLGYITALPLLKHIKSDLLKFIFRCALGWNILVFLIHVLGLISFLNIFVYIFLSIFGLVLFIIVKRKECYKFIVNKLPKYWKNFITILRENKFVSCLLIIFVILLFIVALAPVSKTDELNYYYYFVKRIVAVGGLSFDYFQVVSFQPMAQQLWYVPVYGLSAHEAPALLNLFTSFLIIVVSFFWLRKYIASTFALLAVVATYINLNAISIYAAPQDNVSTWLWGLIALIVTYEFLYSKHDKRKLNTTFLILGLIYATACLIKITNLPLIALCILVVLYKTVKNKWGITRTAMMVIPFAIFYLPFLIKAYLWTGSPLFPALINLFGSTTFDVSAMNVYIKRPSPGWPNNLTGIKDVLVAMFKHNIKYNLSPLLIFSAPIAWFYLYKKKIYAIASITLLYILAIIVGILASPRLLGGVLIFLVLTLFIHARKFACNKYIVGLIKLHIVLLLIITILYSFQFGKFVFGFESKSDFMSEKVQAYQEIQWANKNLPANSKILTTIREKYYFDFPVYCLAEYPLLMGEDARKLKTTEEIYTYLKEKNITHLFLADTHLGFDAEFRIKLDQTGESFGELIYEKENVTVRGFRHPLKKPQKGNLKIYLLN